MIKELWHKKTFHRIFLNDMIKNLNITQSVVIDIGGGDKKSAYHQILTQKGNSFLSVDISSKADYKINLENDKLPFDDNSIKIIFCFNVMEHIFNYQNLLNEIYRALEKDGKIYFYVPFLINKHSDPNDYFRFTDNALKILFEKTGFVYVGHNMLFGSFKMAHTALSWIISNKKLFILGNIANVISGFISYCMDNILNMFSVTKRINQTFILGIYMEYKK